MPGAGCRPLSGPECTGAACSPARRWLSRPEDPWEPGPEGPPAQSRIRWRTGRRAAALLCLVAAVFLGWFWWQAANGTSEVSPLGSVTATESGDGPAPEPEAQPETGPGSAADGPPARTEGTAVATSLCM